MKKDLKNYLINLIFPVLIFGSTTGILTGGIVMLYKFCATHIIHISEKGYHFLKDNLIYIPVVLIALLGVSFLIAIIHKKTPSLRGGGIPTSIAVLRGIITFKWLRNLIGVFFLSLTSFLIGVPLGNEGPSVQMGTAIGSGTVSTLAKNHKAWNRYSMTGGACAGFAVATGAPISGIMFAVEEAHQRISPMIIMVSSISVLFANITAEILSPILGISTNLFPEMEIVSLNLKNIWIPIVIGIIVGLFAVFFLNYYKVLKTLFGKHFGKIPHGIKIFAVFAVTLALGLVSQSYISTGHELIISLFEDNIALITLLLILVVRTTLTLCANTNRITGGMFIPLLAIGAVLASLIEKLLVSVFGITEQYHSIILVFGITACIAALMKMPITAIIFAVEVLGCYENIIYVVIVAALAYILTEIFDVMSINDTVVDDKLEELKEGHTPKVIDTYVTVKKNSFAVEKHVRDIFWPPSLFVLSVKHQEPISPANVKHTGKAICEGDVLHVRYTTFDEERTMAELEAIVGVQER